MAVYENTIPRCVDWLARHPDGCDTTEVSIGLGTSYAHTSGALSLAADRGLVRWVHAPFGKAQNRRVYFALEHAPEVHGPASRKQVQPKQSMHWKDRAKRRMEAKSTAAQKAAGFSSVSRNTEPQKIPAKVDMRFIPERVEPFFSAMTPGSYIRTGSAIERAYAERDARAQGSEAAHAAG